MDPRDSSVNIVSLLMFSIIFRFLRTLSITLILNEKYMCCLQVPNSSPRKYIAYSLALYYLSLIRSGISWIKSWDSSVNVVSVFNFTIILCYHIKNLLIISNFPNYQNLDDKLIWECVESFLQVLDSRFVIIDVSCSEKTLF